MESKPLIDYFADGITKDGEDPRDDVRFTFGEADGAVVLSVNEGEPVAIPLDAIFDLYVIANSIVRHKTQVLPEGWQ